MVYRCAHCGYKITDTYHQTKALIAIGTTVCDHCHGDLKTREDFVKTV